MEDKLKSREFADQCFMLEALNTEAVTTAESVIEIELPLEDRELNQGAIVTNKPQYAKNNCTLRLALEMPGRRELANPHILKMDKDNAGDKDG
jgi:hypothetical protein